MPPKKSPLPLIAQIQFHLSQLGASNGHHEFEHLCRHLAREAITPNILPATGPVSSGGDQGRDFETFKTFIQRKPKDTALFVGSGGESKTLVFACTVQRQSLAKKIEGDVQSICAGTSPDFIYYFSIQDIPIAKRHALKDWCRKSHQCELEILDLQAISEQLSDPTRFWIAEQYLHIPSQIFPETAGMDRQSRYAGLRKKWLDEATAPVNYAHFVEIKDGLRAATFTEDLRQDLSRWIGVISRFMDQDVSDSLRRRATYEICVATLRGLHDLTPQRPLVEAYFNTWGCPGGPDLAGLMDATVLLSYCSTAVQTGELVIDVGLLHSWSKTLVAYLEDEISKAPGPNTMAELLYIRSYATYLPFTRGTAVSVDLRETFHWWFKLAAAAKKARLFPIEQVADLMTALTPIFGQDERFSTLVERIDALLEERSRGFLVAEKCRDRAYALLEANKPLEAIDELHRVKVRWFTGDSLRGSVMALLVLSDAYLDLGLVYAAKHHALGAAFLIGRSTEDEIREMLPTALFQLGNCAYQGGEWASFAEYFPMFFSAHYQYASNAEEWNGSEFMQGSLLHFMLTRALGKALGGQPIVDIVEQPFRALKMPASLRAEILDSELAMQMYSALPHGEVVEKARSELWGLPFSDCGEQRTYRWQALGITWSASCLNSLDQVPCVEEFIATLQIAIADLARSELCLVPTSVHLNVLASNVEKVQLVEMPSNELATFEIAVPIALGSAEKDLHVAHTHTLSVATMVLIWCSCLQDREVNTRIKRAVKDGLLTKTALIRPYRELFLEFCERDAFESRRKHSPVDAKLSAGFRPREAPHLAWRTGPGPGYSAALGLRAVENRYRRTVVPIRTTLARFNTDERFHAWIGKRRHEGMLDWQILSLIFNAVFNYRHPIVGKLSEVDRTALGEFARREESDEDQPYPLQALLDLDLDMAKRVALAAVAATWKLDMRRRTPDFAALQKLLDERYGNREDVAHEDLFLKSS